MNCPSIPGLLRELRRLHRLASAGDILGWDEQVNLPPDSAAFRGEQMAEFSALLHREATSDAFGALIGEAESMLRSGALNADEILVVREARRDFDRATRLPSEFVSRKAAAQSRAYHAWTAARAEDNFAAFAPLLKEQVDLAREEAAFHGYHGSAAYDYWIDQFDPGMDAQTIAGLFESLAVDLPPLVGAIMDSPVKARPDLLRGFDISRQESFLRDVIARLGFDFNRGRLDRSVHPFCSGCGLDTRMTTRFFEDNPLDSLFSGIHETGHGLYEQGLPAEYIGTALGTAAGMAAHESQSRLWENQVGRSRAFWQYWEPFYRQAFPSSLEAVSSDDLYLAINDVHPISIRVDSDEVTYNLHIILRFEIEKALFEDRLAVADLPGEWNALSRKYLGLEPSNNSTGCLQDVHWSGGAFGYFPSYCLGNMLAAQLWHAVNTEIPDLQNQFAAGEFSGLLSWLRDRVHSRGRHLNARSLAEKVTGAPLSPGPLMDYLTERYGSLYGIAG
jgi:carboxypeptidase Taq